MSRKRCSSGESFLLYLCARNVFTFFAFNSFNASFLYTIESDAYSKEPISILKSFGDHSSRMLSSQQDRGSSLTFLLSFSSSLSSRGRRYAFINAPSLIFHIAISFFLSLSLWMSWMKNRKREIVRSLIDDFNDSFL